MKVWRKMEELGLDAAVKVFSLLTGGIILLIGLIGKYAWSQITSATAGVSEVRQSVAILSSMAEANRSEHLEINRKLDILIWRGRR